MSDLIDQYNAMVISREQKAEANAEKHFECSACHDIRSMAENELCVQCTTAALRRFGWL